MTYLAGVTTELDIELCPMKILKSHIVIDIENIKRVMNKERQGEYI